jgi:hypothetical protein
MWTAWDGLQQTVELANEKRIKIVINGGGLNPKGLAEKTNELVCSHNSLDISAKTLHRLKRRA